MPKFGSHHEARVWEMVFGHAEAQLGLPQGPLKTTILIETLPAAFEMYEALHAMRDRIVGLKFGWWERAHGAGGCPCAPDP